MIVDVVRDLSESKVKIMAIDLLLILTMFICIMFSVAFSDNLGNDVEIPENLVILNYPFFKNAPAELEIEIIKFVQEYGYAFMYVQAEPTALAVDGYYIIGKVPGMDQGESGQAYLGYGTQLPGSFTARHSSITFQTVKTLEKNTVFFEPASPVRLDGSVLMWLDSDDFLSGELAWYRTSILHSAVLVEPDLDRLMDLCAKLGQSGIRVNPVPVSARFASNIDRTWSSVVYYSYALWAAFGLAALCACLCCVQMSIQRMREFCVHMLHGAGSGRLFMRLLLFNLAALAAPCAAVIMAMAATVKLTFATVPVCLALAFVISAVAYASVRRNVLVSILKGER